MAHRLYANKPAADFSHPGFCWAIEVLSPASGEWIRCGPYYRHRSTATGWLSFVKRFHYAECGRTVKVKLAEEK